jgi:hypothetical protein
VTSISKIAIDVIRGKASESEVEVDDDGRGSRKGI